MTLPSAQSRPWTSPWHLRLLSRRWPLSQSSRAHLQQLWRIFSAIYYLCWVLWWLWRSRGPCLACSLWLQYLHTAQSPAWRKNLTVGLYGVLWNDDSSRKRKSWPNWQYRSGNWMAFIKDGWDIWSLSRPTVDTEEMIYCLWKSVRCFWY